MGSRRSTFAYGAVSDAAETGYVEHSAEVEAGPQDTGWCQELGRVEPCWNHEEVI